MSPVASLEHGLAKAAEALATPAAIWETRLNLLEAGRLAGTYAKERNRY